jgi:hypothetical protein
MMKANDWLWGLSFKKLFFRSDKPKRMHAYSKITCKQGIFVKPNTKFPNIELFDTIAEFKKFYDKYIKDAKSLTFHKNKVNTI